jgi:hypothetical protein
MTANSNAVINLLPCFIAALAAQRLTEFVDLGVRQVKSSEEWPSKKTWYLAAIVAAAGIVSAVGGEPFRALAAVGVHTTAWIDVPISALVISGGTETINEVLKLLGYKKDETKEKAKGLQPPAAAAKTHLKRS